MSYKQPTYKATYRKNDGTLRTMIFVKLSDMPQKMMDSLIKGTGKQRVLNEGQELVYDVEKRGLRLFNYSTTIGEVERLDAPQSAD